MHAVEAVDQTLRRLFWPVSFIARSCTIKATRATNPFLVSRILLTGLVSCCVFILKDLSEIARCFQQTSSESRSPTKFIDIVQLPGTPRFSRSVLEIATVNCWQILGRSFRISKKKQK